MPASRAAVASPIPEDAPVTSMMRGFAGTVDIPA
jgi:hypothetical protein